MTPCRGCGKPSTLAYLTGDTRPHPLDNDAWMPVVWYLCQDCYLVRHSLGDDPPVVGA